jgi:hypothetical protein
VFTERVETRQLVVLAHEACSTAAMFGLKATGRVDFVQVAPRLVEMKAVNVKLSAGVVNKTQNVGAPHDMTPP